MDDLKKAVNAPERLINANELMEWLRSKIRECVFLNAHAEAAITEEIIRYVKHMPAVEAMPVVHAKWIHLDPRECATVSGKCSCCGWEAHYYEDDVADMPYCPACGARMDGEANG